MGGKLINSTELKKNILKIKTNISNVEPNGLICFEMSRRYRELNDQLQNIQK